LYRLIVPLDSFSLISRLAGDGKRNAALCTLCPYYRKCHSLATPSAWHNEVLIGFAAI
jgi:hypothetical protein